jgi:hypothetical protein
MKFAHNGLQIELNDDWWAEAGMDNFVPTSCSYRVAQTNQQVHEVLIDEVGPVQRGAGVGIFNDSIEEGSARDRVIRILRGFRLGEPIPPVEIVAQRGGMPASVQTRTRCSSFLLLLSRRIHTRTHR